MSDDKRGKPPGGGPKPPHEQRPGAPADEKDETGIKRRDLFTRASTLAMAGGLAAGYGAFGAIAARYLYPAHPPAMGWVYVSDVSIVRIQGVTELKFRDEAKGKADHFQFFPDHLYTELIIGLILMLLLSALATTLPAVLGPKADPLSTPEVIKPEWYFYVAFRWLKLFSGTVALLSMGLIVFTMFTWPFIDAWLRRTTRIEELSVWVGIAGVFLIIGLTLWEAIAPH